MINNEFGTLDYPVIIFHTDDPYSTIYFNCDYERPDTDNSMHANRTALNSRTSPEVIVDSQGRCLKLVNMTPVLTCWQDRIKYWLDCQVPVKTTVVREPVPWTAEQVKEQVLRSMNTHPTWEAYVPSWLEYMKRAVSASTSIREVIELFRGV